MIDNKSYNLCLREVYDKQEKDRIGFFLRENQIFKNFEKETFLKKYYSFFILENVPRYDYLIMENKTPSNIFFIKNGEYEITLRKSLNEINELLKDYWGKEVSDKDEKEKMNRNDNFAKFMNERRNVKVIIHNNPFSYVY